MRFLFHSVIFCLVLAAAPAYSMSLFLNSFTNDPAKLSHYCTLIYNHVVFLNDGEPAEYVTRDDIGNFENMLTQLHAAGLVAPEAFKKQAESEIKTYQAESVPQKVSAEYFKGDFFGCKSAMSYHVVSTYQNIERRPDVVEKEEPKEEKRKSPWAIIFGFIFG